MRMAAVANLDIFGGGIEQCVVDVTDNDGWKEACIKAIKKGGMTMAIPDDELISYIGDLPNNYSEAKEIFYLSGNTHISVIFFGI